MMRWAEHVAHGETKKCVQNLILTKCFNS